MVSKAKNSQFANTVTSKATGALNKVKNNGFIQDVTGVTKNNALKGVNNASSALDSFANTNSTFKNLQNNISQITDKLSDVDKHLPGNISDKVNSAKNNINYISTKNNTLLNKGQQQGFIKNLLDKDVRNAQKELADAQKKFTALSNQKNKIKNGFVENLNIDLDKNVADLDMFKKNNKTYQNLTGGLIDAQNAYDKALRRTKKARTAVIGTTAGVGAGAYALNKNKKNKEQQEQLQYIDPSIGLNNNI